jgi:two-component system cell cycle response regulator DivK
MSPLVLIADDADDILEAHGEILRDAGYGVAFAHDGNEAVARAIELRPDVILMDLQMPGLDGWEATRRIRADLRTHRIPIVALTSHALRRYADRSFEAGCTSFLNKPMVTGPVLVDEVRRVLKRRAPPFGVVVGEVVDRGSGATRR